MAAEVVSHIRLSAYPFTVTSSPVTVALAIRARTLDLIVLSTTLTPKEPPPDKPTAMLVATAVARRSASSSAITETSSVALTVRFAPLINASTSLSTSTSRPNPPPANATPPMETLAITASRSRTSARVTSALTTTSSPAVIVSVPDDSIRASTLFSISMTTIATPIETATTPPDKLAPTASAPSTRELEVDRTMTSPAAVTLESIIAASECDENLVVDSAPAAATAPPIEIPTASDPA